MQQREGGSRASSGPNVRYLLACAALAVMAAAPLLTWNLLRPPAPVPSPRPSRRRFPPPLAPPAAMRPHRFASACIDAVPAPLLPWVVAVWLAGAMAFWLRLLGGWIFAERLRSRLVRPAPREWQQTLDRLKARIRVSRPVRLLVSSLVQAPAVVGWLRPVVLVPVGALAGLPPEQMEALLLHELAHIRRHDYLVNVLQSVVEALLFYHPAVWWVSGHIRAERELCCDDVAISVSGDAVTYARALAELASARPAHFRAVMAANGGSLAHRIARLLGQPRPAPRTLSGPGIVAAAILLAITAFAVFGQPAARPKFEVASVKPSAEQRFKMVRPLPGRLTADAPVRLLMQNAYAVQPFQIVGGPDWVNSERYADRSQSRRQGQSRPDIPHAAVAPRGPFPVEDPPRDAGTPRLCAGPCQKRPQAAAAEGGRLREPCPGRASRLGRRQNAPPGQGQPPWRGVAAPASWWNPTAHACRAERSPCRSSSACSRWCSAALSIDKTGFTDLFDLRLDFLPDEITAALPPPPPDCRRNRFQNPSILTALQEQLGLRLESTKGPVEVIVIDHVERPTAN